eukprot:TRINITY_DN8202_c0_g1::TRINITY_DN8202_c0_g1_i1::g.7175::m.7175 TRINITY_DN8202_c0_g1::TRINITY_DN8202_c0_g1_i1::g.7175  ORF type:complete len:439 (-),score=10.00,DUF605/PF04652.11/0.0085 TRINITY_DN8202_c0_g1_i1:112-1428(-)
MSIASSSSQSSSSQNPNLSILPDLNSLDLVQLLAIVRSIVSKITVEKRDLLLDLSTEYTGEIHIQAVLDEQELKVLCGVVGEIEKRCCRERDSHNEIEGPSMESSLISSVKNDLVSLLRLCHGHSELYHQILRILASVSLPDSKSIRRPLSRPRSPVRAADYTYAQYTPEERFLSPPETDPAFTGYYYTPREKSILSAFSSSSAISKGNGMSSPTSSRSSNHSMNPNNSNNNNYHYHNQNLYLERPRTPSSPADFTPPSSYNPSFEPSSSPSHPSAHTQSHPNSISLGMVPPRPFSAPNSAPMPPPASVPLLDVCDDGEYPFGDPPIQTTPHAHQIQNRNTATPPTTYTQHTSVTGSHPASPYRSSSTSVYPPPVQTSTSSGPHPAAPAIPSLSQSPSLSFPSSSRNPIRRAQASEESILSEMHGRSPAFSVKVGKKN